MAFGKTPRSGLMRALIVGLGNVGREVLKQTIECEDMEPAGIVTRNPDRVMAEGVDCPVFHADDVEAWTRVGARVAILCGGSKDDLPTQGPFFARRICTVCSFDTHAHLGPYKDEVSGVQEAGYLAEMDAAAKHGRYMSIVSTGWDPGSFSLMRTYFTACMLGAKAYAFYGVTDRGGLSMGHSDAIRTIDGVLDARSFTHAIPQAIERVRKGENPDFSAGEMHWRENFVVLHQGADPEVVKEQIVNMPAYFAGYKTTVEFITSDKMETLRSDMRHNGVVIAVNNTGIMEFKNEWTSNPAGTAGIMLAYARAAGRGAINGKTGAFTVLDIPFADLLPSSVSRLSLI